MKQLSLLTAVLLLPLANGQDKAVQDNIVVVVDASGSMERRMSGSNESKMQIAKEALKQVLGNAGEGTNVGIIVFGKVRDEWVYPLGPRDNTRLYASIDSINAGGGTPLGEFIKKGADRLLQQRSQQHGYGSYRLLVVTDGEASDEGKVNKFTPDVMSRGIMVDVIGVDMKSNHTLAQPGRVHSYRSANDPAALAKAVQEVLAEVGSSDDSSVDESVFDDLEGMDEAAAKAILRALSNSGNHPIGGQPSVQSGSSYSNPGTAPADSGRVRGWIIGLGVVVLVVVVGVILVVVGGVLRK